MLGWLKKMRRHKPLVPGDPLGGGGDPPSGLLALPQGGSRLPQVGHDMQPETQTAEANPHCGSSQLERAQLERAKAALEDTARTWCGPARATAWPGGRGAKELAREFHRQLQMQPDLAGCVVHQVWIERHYVVFCEWLRVTSPPPYRDFARELARIMPRKRKDERLGRGPDRVGSTCTVYCISSRAATGRKRASKASSQEGGGAAVVDLEAVRAQRAAEASQARPADRCRARPA